jgi:hypothetical protein
MKGNVLWIREAARLSEAGSNRSSNNAGLSRAPFIRHALDDLADAVE